jgi:DNA-binding XRE family transcriptional regulator
MPAHKLDNYLVMYRKRAGFSQDEVAYLLGAQSGSMNCRYERFKRKPSLEAALAPAAWSA